MTKYKYKFSVVVAVYNMEKYLDDLVNSIINQTIGFNHIQLILVNDGSSDRSHQICSQYQSKYPNNIVYVNKENGGVSSARNAGIEKCEGELVNFADADDCFSLDSFELVYDFYTKHKDEIETVSIPMVYFEARKGNHLLNYKFYSTRVIDIEKEPRCIQLAINSTFTKNEVAKLFRFNSNLKYGEDAEIINKIILRKMKFGVVREAQYLYRIRYAGDSALQKSKQDKLFYNTVLDNLHAELIRYSLEKYNNIPKYLQYVLIYELSWKYNVSQIGPNVLSPEEYSQFLEKTHWELQYIDDQAIWDLKKPIALKIYLISLKHNIKDINDNIQIFTNGSDVGLAYNDYIISYNLNFKFNMYTVDIVNENLCIEGTIQSYLPHNDLEISATTYAKDRVSNKWKSILTEFEVVNRPHNNSYSLNKEIFRYRTVCSTINIKDYSAIQLELHCKYKDIQLPVKIIPIKECYLNTPIEPCYAIKRDRIISLPDSNHLLIEDFSKKHALELEKIFQKNLACVRPKIDNLDVLCSIRDRIINDYQNRKKVWLISDRTYEADDNGEHFFKYAVSVNDDIEKYFVLDKDSKDYERLSKFGKVVSFGSPEHIYLACIADKIISSQADAIVYKPFGNASTFFLNISTADRVFLQHGITKDDMSDWLQKKNKNLRIITTAATMEQDSMATDAYGYTDKEIILSGFARYDNLISEPKKEILFVPTWDNRLIKIVDGKAVYSDQYKKSLHCQNINDFLNNPKLLKIFDEYGYKIKFRPHPHLLAQLPDYNLNPYVELVDSSVSYQALFKTGSIMITDYSSVQFDFAYMKKPVIYYQFTDNHLESGYFDYKTMGFGPVLNTADLVVEKIIDYIKNNCKLEDKYVTRVDNFFKFTDHENCKRIYDAICNAN